MLHFKIHFLSILQDIHLNCCCSVTESCLALWPHGLQHARLPCPSQSLRVCLNSCPLSWWYHPIISFAAAPSPPVFNLSQHQVLSQWVSSLHQVAKVLWFQFQHQSFQWIFRVDFLIIDWFDLLAVQGTLKSLLQHHSSKASILRYSAFFTVQLSHPYMTTGKTTALTRWSFVGKVMSLLFNKLSKLVTAFLPRSKCFFLNFMAAVTICSESSRKTSILGLQKSPRELVKNCPML